MDDTKLYERITAEIEEIDTRIAWHENELVELGQLKSALTRFAERRRPGAERFPNPSITSDLVELARRQTEKDIEEADIFPLDEASEAAYGDLARALRKYIVLGQGGVRKRREIVAATKESGASVNFPYRFIKRMLDTGELVEVDRGVYAATPKMVRKVEG